MRLSNLIYSIGLTVLIVEPTLAQDDGKKEVYDGNKLYNTGRLLESTTAYREALKVNPNNQKAHFNLGNSLYRNALQIKASKENFNQGGKKVTPDSLAGLVFDEAANNYAQVANSISDKDTLHRAWHNIGNCYLQKKDYEQAVDAYKKSLKYNPKDEETRYNLAYALKHMPKDKKGGGGSSQPQNQKKEDKNDKNKNAQPKNEMNKEQAEQLLKALMNQEKKLQDKRKQQQEDPSNSQKGKDW